MNTNIYGDFQICISVPLISLKKMQKQPPEVFYKKTVVKKLAIFTEQNLCLESLFNSEYCEIFKSSYFEEHLRTAPSENVFMKPYDETEKKKLVHKEF